MTSEETAEKFLSELQLYKSAVEDLRPIKRPMLLWSVVSLVYVHGGLHLKIDAIALWGVQITGITEEKFLIFLLSATFYYMVKWFWSNFLKLRSYWREGFVSELWQHLIVPQKAGDTGSYLEDGEGYNEVTKHQDNIVIDETIEIIKNDKDLSGTVRDLTRFSVVSLVELFVVPYVLPLVISGSALMALLSRLL